MLAARSQSVTRTLIGSCDCDVSAFYGGGLWRLSAMMVVGDPILSLALLQICLGRVKRLPLIAAQSLDAYVRR
jgi:hypothetical protein